MLKSYMFGIRNLSVLSYKTCSFMIYEDSLDQLNTYELKQLDIVDGRLHTWIS